MIRESISKSLYICAFCSIMAMFISTMALVVTGITLAVFGDIPAMMDAGLLEDLPGLLFFVICAPFMVYLFVLFVSLALARQNSKMLSHYKDKMEPLVGEVFPMSKLRTYAGEIGGFKVDTVVCDDVSRSGGWGPYHIIKLNQLKTTWSIGFHRNESTATNRLLSSLSTWYQDKYHKDYFEEGGGYKFKIPVADGTGEIEVRTRNNHVLVDRLLEEASEEITHLLRVVRPGEAVSLAASYNQLVLYRQWSTLQIPWEDWKRDVQCMVEYASRLERLEGGLEPLQEDIERHDLWLTYNKSINGFRRLPMFLNLLMVMGALSLVMCSMMFQFLTLLTFLSDPFPEPVGPMNVKVVTRPEGTASSLICGAGDVSYTGPIDFVNFTDVVVEAGTSCQVCIRDAFTGCGDSSRRTHFEVRSSGTVTCSALEDRVDCQW